MTKLTLPEHLMWSIRFALIVLVPVESIPYALESNSHNFPAIPEGNQSQGQSFTDWGMDYHIDYWTFTGSLHAFWVLSLRLLLSPTTSYFARTLAYPLHRLDDCALRRHIHSVLPQYVI